MTILEDILATKRKEVAILREKWSIEDLNRLVQQQGKPRAFAAALQHQDPVALIAEIKKASPSKGVIQPDFQPMKQAKAYEDGGAHALSVLTDETYFQGSCEILRQVRSVTELPILRKDFIIDPWQVYEARIIGADAILLIVAALSDQTLRELYQLARSLSLDVLIEVHNEEEYDRVVDVSSALIGINNRDLHTFSVDLEQTRHVAARVSARSLLVSESGIATHDDVRFVKEAGAKAILVGETLMRQGLDQVGSTMAQLMGHFA